MATFHDRTTAPRVQLGLLRAAGPCRVLTSDEVITLTAWPGPELPVPFVFRPSPPVDDPRSADDLLEEIRRTVEGQEAFKSKIEIIHLRREDPKFPWITDAKVVGDLA